MIYLVMECHPSYAVLLDEEGRFVKAANLHYEVGQKVENPILMKKDSQKKQHKVGWIGSGLAVVAACLLVIFGIGQYQNDMTPYSSIFLTINPEVRMDLNRQGIVVGLDGTNEDGVKLLEGYDGKGKDKVTVADELIDRAIAMGFLSEGGRVSFSVDTPDEVLFQEYGLELRSKVTEYLKGRITVTIEITDYNSKENTDDSSSSSTPSEVSSAASSTPPESAPPVSSQPSQPVYVPPTDSDDDGSDDDDDSDDEEWDDSQDDDDDDDDDDNYENDDD